MCGRRRRDIGGRDIEKKARGALFLVLKNRGARQGAGSAGRYWRADIGGGLGLKTERAFLFGFCSVWKTLWKCGKNKIKICLTYFDLWSIMKA